MVQAAEAAEINAAASESMAAILMPPPQAPSDLLINCPSWALRLKKCEVSYYPSNLLINFHPEP